MFDFINILFLCIDAMIRLVIDYICIFVYQFNSIQFNSKLERCSIREALGVFARFEVLRLFFVAFYIFFNQCVVLKTLVFRT